MIKTGIPNTMMNYCKIVLISATVLLTGCVEGFEIHLKDAIELYKERKVQYAEQSDGKTNALFTKLITTETLLLPVAATFDARAVPYVKDGVMIIANDFVPMEDNLGFDHPMARADELSPELITEAKEILSALNSSNSHDAFAITEAVNTALLAIDDFERYNNVHIAMTKHLVESLGFGALHSLYYRCESQDKTYRLGQDLMLLQAAAIKISNPLSYDKQANEFHQQSIGILVNDLPHIPFLKEYDKYKMLDEERLSDCLIKEI